MRKKRKKRSKLKILKDKAWKLFSLYIRKKELGICFTCGKQGDIKDMQAGHFKHRKLDFDERNIHCQCKRCNSKFMLRGNLDVYAVKLEEAYGYGILQDLTIAARPAHKYSQQELEDIIDKYSYKLQEFE